MKTTKVSASSSIKRPRPSSFVPSDGRRRLFYIFQRGPRGLLTVVGPLGMSSTAGNWHHGFQAKLKTRVLEVNKADGRATLGI